MHSPFWQPWVNLRDGGKPILTNPLPTEGRHVTLFSNQQSRPESYEEVLQKEQKFGVGEKHGRSSLRLFNLPQRSCQDY